MIEEHDDARAEGVDVWPQVSCRPLVFQMNLAEPFTLNMRDSFQALMSKTRDERKEAYADPSWRAMAWADVGGKVDWSSLSVAESERRPDLVGRLVLDLAASRAGTTPLDVMLDLSLEDDLRTRFWSVLANNDPDGIAWLLPRDGVLLGLADSGAHVSQLCDACFATDLLGGWVRDREVMPLERAIHKLTGEPAAVYGLTDRGLVAGGQGGRPRRVRPRHRRPRSAAPRLRLPRRRRAPHRRRARGHAPHARQRRRDPRGRRAERRGPGGATGRPRALTRRRCAAG